MSSCQNYISYTEEVKRDSFKSLFYFKNVMFAFFSIVILSASIDIRLYENSFNLVPRASCFFFFFFFILIFYDIKIKKNEKTRSPGNEVAWY